MYIMEGISLPILPALPEVRRNGRSEPLDSTLITTETLPTSRLHLPLPASLLYADTNLWRYASSSLSISSPRPVSSSASTDGSLGMAQPR